MSGAIALTLPKEKFCNDLMEEFFDVGAILKMGPRLERREEKMKKMEDEDKEKGYALFH